MMKRLLILVIVLGCASSLSAQQRLSPPKVATLPSSCNVGDIVNLTTGTVGDYICTAANTWNIITTGAATGAPVDATYLVKTANSTLTAEQAMGSLATGIVKNTTTTGVQSIAVAGTDYQAPITGNGVLTPNTAAMALTSVVAPTTAPTLAVGAAGVPSGTYTYFVTFTTAYGETELGIESGPVTVTNQRVNLSAIPVSANPAVTGRKLYRGAGQYANYLVATIADNTTTTLIDNAADGTPLGDLLVYRELLNTTSAVILDGQPVVQVHPFIADTADTLILIGRQQPAPAYGVSAVLIGARTAATMTTALRPTAVGNAALGALTDGGDNSAFGDLAGANITVGSNNTTIGALSMSTTSGVGGSNNSALGWTALVQSRGDQNTSVGASTCAAITSGANNTCLGYGANAPSNTSNQMFFGNSSVTDAYFGSSTAAANIRAANYIVSNGKALQTDTTTAHTALLQAYDTDTGPAYVTCGTLTNGNSPSFALSNAGGCAISITGATLVTPALGVATATSVTGRFITSGSAPTVDDTSGGNSCGAAGNPSMNGGNDNAFEFNVGAGGGTDCTVTLTAAAPNRWDCHANNETSAVLTRTVYVDTTHIKVQGVLGAADVISVMCFAR